MAFKFGKMLVHAVIIGLLLAILVMLVQGRSNFKSYYEPANIVTVAGPNAMADPKSIFDLKVGVDCVPGPSEKAAYYTQGLTPGGLCDSGEYVRDQQRDYAIADGVGGSLLEK
jgi:cytochrome c-type biogenesis protein CcmE